MKTPIPEEAMPLIDAIARGIPVGKFKPGEPCPDLPAVPMIVLIDDAQGQGPAAFDAAKLFDEIDSVVIATPPALAAGATAVAARASAGGRAVFVQASAETLALWLALVSERRKLAHDFACLLGAGDVPDDVKLMLRDIAAISGASLN